MGDYFGLKYCKKLKDWGMPQRVDAGGWVYWTGEIDEHFKGRPLLLGVDIVRIQLEHCENDWVLCPDLDELLEFARGLNENWVMYPDGDKFVVELYGPGGLPSSLKEYWLDNPKLAVYKLIEKLQEVERGDDKV